MAKFHGRTNLRVGHPAWAAAEYDDQSHDYVIEVDGKDAERFRAVAGDYGFVEESAPEPEKKPVAGKRARKAVEDA